MFLYSGGENPHTKTMFRELSALQLASHPAKTGKLCTQKIHIRTHPQKHVLSFKSGF